MPKVYEATQLPENEWLVLDALVTAAKEGEAPLTWETLAREYESLEDVTEPLPTVLSRLHDKGLAGLDLAEVASVRHGWYPTPRGYQVVEFNEKTAYLKDT